LNRGYIFALFYFDLLDREFSAFFPFFVQNAEFQLRFAKVFGAEQAKLRFQVISF
jgi:hypothetical protein